MRTGLIAAALLVLLAGGSSGAATSGSDWPMFGYDAARENVGPASPGITAANVATLRRRKIELDGTVDSSPIYLHGVTVRGAKHDTIFVTTTYGRTEAIDAASGRVLWRYTPAAYSSLAGSPQITVMTPLADPSRTAVYAGEPDGKIVRLSVASGSVIWTATITSDPTHEKLAGSLNYSRGHVLAATDGYLGDAPPYQGHVVSLDPATGSLLAVWNSLCSDLHALIQPSNCPASDSAIWGRSAPVVDPASGDILVATGNAPWNGSTNWGDSVLVLSPDAKQLLKHWTPANQAKLNAGDLDLGSTAPALLAGGYFVQGGKDGKIRLLRLSTLAGVNAHLGGELQTIPTPGPTDLFSEPAVWQGTWLFVADGAGTQAWRLRGGRLHAAWSNANGGTSPVVAGGLLYVEGSGGINVYVPSSGLPLATLPIGEVHWESPIVADGRVIAAEGSSNDHATSGVLDIYTLPA